MINTNTPGMDAGRYKYYDIVPRGTSSSCRPTALRLPPVRPTTTPISSSSSRES